MIGNFANSFISVIFNYFSTDVQRVFDNVHL